METSVDIYFYRLPWKLLWTLLETSMEADRKSEIMWWAQVDARYDVRRTTTAGVGHASKQAPPSLPMCVLNLINVYDPVNPVNGAPLVDLSCQLLTPREDQCHPLISRQHEKLRTAR